jgi:hypothetical protein
MKSMEHGPQPHPRLGEQGQVWAETVAESRVFAWRRYAQLMCGWSKGVLVRSYDSDEPYLMFRTLTKVLWKLDIMHHQWCKQLALLNIKFILSLWIFLYLSQGLVFHAMAAGTGIPKRRAGWSMWIWAHLWTRTSIWGRILERRVTIGGA